MKLFRCCLFYFQLVTLIFAFLVHAGTTGKVVGTVLDSQTNEPLIGVNVVVENSTLGASTDAAGRFFILNLPPGAYNLKFTMMGYKEYRVEAVRVRADFTSTINSKLEPTVLESGEAITVSAERPLVRLDMTSTLSSVVAEDIKSLPVQSLQDVLKLQAGVVSEGGQLHIRGGRGGEVAYWIDGVSTTNALSGGMGIMVENSAIQELQVISGTFNSEYGQAMSGIINVITKDGGSKYEGQVKVYAGDYLSSRDEFRINKSINLEHDSNSGKFVPRAKSENPLKKLNPIYNGEFSLSGPMPLLKNKVHFFMNGRYYNREGYLYGREWYTPFGFAGDSALVAMNPHEKYSGQFKLTFNLTSNIRLRYNLINDNWQNDRSYSKDLRYNPNGTLQSKGHSTSQIFTFNHLLSEKSFYELKLNRLSTWYKSYVYENPNASAHYLGEVVADPNGVPVSMFFNLDNPEQNEAFHSYRQQRYQTRISIAPDSPAGYIHQDSLRSYPAAYSFHNDGVDLRHHHNTTSYWVGKFDFTSQMNRINEIKCGFEGRYHTLHLDNYTLIPKVDEKSNEAIVPFVPSIPQISSLNRDFYERNPYEFSAYFQDKIEANHIILNLGLRYDYFNANSVIPSDPSDPNIYEPFKDQNIYKNPKAPVESRIAYTPEERRNFMHQKVKAKMQISPRLGIAYPITDKGAIHFSYGHFFQIPEFQYLYQNADFKLAKGSGNFLTGNADLKAQKTVQYEVGLQQQLAENIGLDITLFYRDIRDWVGTSPLISTNNISVKYSKYENKDYSNVRGITFKLDKRYSNNFSARLDYSFQVAEGTYSNPTDAYNAVNANQEPRIALIPLNWDQNHTLNLSAIYQYGSWTMSAIGRYWTGRPYTPSFPVTEFIGGTRLSALKENSERLPTQKSVDIYLNKRIDFNSFAFTLFCNIYNLFDQANETQVYSDTGTAGHTTGIDPEKISYDPARVSTVNDYITQPDWYSAPRELQLGLTFEF